MRKLTFLFVFIAAAVCLQAQTLTWDIKFLKGTSQESIPINQIIRMETGQDFQIKIFPTSGCFCYVIFYDSKRQIAVLHSGQVSGNKEITIEPIHIDPPSGTETVYVIMSLTRQTKLEELILAQKNNPKGRQQANNLYREVVSLQKTASGLGEPASSFVPCGGTNRQIDLKNATLFSGKNMYVRAITIRH